MYIISGFKDYYDYIPNQLGIDKRNVFNRDKCKSLPSELEVLWKRVTSYNDTYNDVKKEYLLLVIGNNFYPIKQESIYKDYRIIDVVYTFLDIDISHNQVDTYTLAGRYGAVVRKLKDVYLKVGNPCFLIRYDTQPANLLSLGFNKIMQAQDVYMLIESANTAILGLNDKSVADVPDNFRIAQHGFDKHSFRKMKGE